MTRTNIVQVVFTFLLAIGSHVTAQGTKPTQSETGKNGADQLEFYQPVIRDIEGWTVKVDPNLLSPENSERGALALKALANHLQRVTFILPKRKVEELREIPIWIEQSGQGRGLVYHPNPNWLSQNGFNPAMAKHVHVPKPEHLLDARQWSKHPYAIMHELAHAYHDQVLGWDDPEIKGAFRQAQKSRIYERVLTHNHQVVEHYALSNHKEYFAESTEAYLGVNDFYPFVRAELKEHDPRMFELQRKIWGPIR